MNRTTGVLIALVCGSSLAIAQGGPDRGGDRGGGDGGGFSRGGGSGEMRGGGGGERGFGGGGERSMERSAPEPRPERAAPSRAERAAPRVERRERQRAEPREQQEPRSPRRAERNDSDRKEALDRKREARDADRASRDKEPKNKAPDKASEQADAKNKRDRDGSSSAEGRGEGESGRGAEAGKRGDTADRATGKRDRPAQLAGEKRDRVRTVFRDKAHAKRRTGVNINISLGRRLPRDWNYYPVPIEIVEIVPEYRDYVFVWVDDEYVICDPDTYEVVAVIPVDDGPSYAGGRSGRAECSRDLALNRDERELIVELARSEDEVDVDDLEVGWSVPGNIELHEFTGPVLERADELGACRYFVADDSIAVVDPDESKVVLVIDRS